MNALWKSTGAIVGAGLAMMGSGCVTSKDAVVSDYDSIPSDAYAIVAEVRAKPGKADALRLETRPLIEAVRNEPNNLLYFLQEDREMPGRFIFYEIFATRADFEKHNATPHVQAWFAKLPELADGGVRVTRMEILRNSSTARAEASSSYAGAKAP